MSLAGFDPMQLVQLTYTEEDIKILQWIHDEGHFCDTNEFLTAAVARGNLIALRWCPKMGVHGTTVNCRMAAEKCRLDILKLLR